MANKPSPKKDAADRSILINFVLDRSGSMDVIRDATISGFNEFKNAQKLEEGKAFFTLTLFDTRFETVCQAVPLSEVPDLDHDSFRPDGMTALYDAIGHTMRITDDFYAANHPDQVLFVVMTDGGENSSRQFSRERIFDMIQDRQKLAQYEFMYLGANQDSYAVGHSIGLKEGRSVDWAGDADGVRVAAKRAASNASAYRRRGESVQDGMFHESFEALGTMPAAAWKAMDPAERQRRLDEEREARERKQG